MAKKAPKPEAVEKLWKRRLFDRLLIEDKTISRYERLADRRLSSVRLTTNDIYFLYSNLSSLLESSVRDLVRLRIDAGDSNFSELPNDLRQPNIDLDLISGLRKRRYTIGDIVSFSFNVSSVEQVYSIVGALYGERAIDGALEAISQDYSKEVGFHEEPSYYMNIFAGNVFSKRHELIHELSETMFSDTQSEHWDKEQIDIDLSWGIKLLRCLQLVKKERYEPEPQAEPESRSDNIFDDVARLDSDLYRLRELCKRRIDSLYKLLGHERSEILRMIVYSYQDYNSAFSELQYELYRPGTMASLAALSSQVTLTRRLLSDLNGLLRDLRR